MGLEGIICKQADAPTEPGAAVLAEGEVPGPRGVRGARLDAAGRAAAPGWAALHVGFYDPQGRLHYAGGVGTGFTEASCGRLHAG